MHYIDWTILIASLVLIVLYGLYKGHGNKDIKGFLLADQNMKWYTIAISIMATQASAITFLSGPGQAYTDGMRFVQFYFGLPIATVILSITAIPVYHKLKVFTAYEYLENRFDVRVRVLASLLFLMQRGLAAGLTIFAPALVLSLMLGWDLYITNLIIGTLVIIYTAFGGTKAVGHTHFYQMLIIFFGMFSAFMLILFKLPEGVGFGEALHVAGKMGKLNAIDFSFDLNNRYTVWTGILGGLFLQLSYFGTDQSQVQRYLAGKSVTQSRIGLLINGLVKIPMQFSILLLGAMVFVFYQFNTPPVFFNSVELENLKQSEYSGKLTQVEEQFENLQQVKKEKLMTMVQTGQYDQQELQDLQQKQQLIKQEAVGLIKAGNPQADPKDTNFIFLNFVLANLPVGLIGLVIAAIIAASMSSTAGELNALASTTVVDIYKRIINKNAGEKKYVMVSRLATIGWGIYAIVLAEYASRLGSLIEAVNILGSLFYGTILGIFLVAFYFKKISGKATFYSAFIAEFLVILSFIYTDISFLWYNVIGCAGVIVFAGLLNSLLIRKK